MSTPAPQPGDLVFCHSTGFVGGGIRLIEKFRRDWAKTNEAGGAKYNHVAILDEPLNATDWSIIQAEASGVTDTGWLSDVAPGGSYTIVPLPDGVNRERVLAFARAQVGYRYGWLTDASILVTLFTPTFVNLTAPHTWICSALGAESLRCGGWIHDWADLLAVTPAQLWLALEG